MTERDDVVRQLQQRVAALEGDSGDLASRVEQLETGLEQERGLHRQIAELVDLVQEILLPAPKRDEKRLTRLLGRYVRES